MMLQLSNVVKKFGELAAVDGVSLEVQEGSFVGLIGPNGSGKTTLFNVIGGVYKPDSGEICFKKERIDGLSPDQVYKRGIVRSFQIPRLFFGMTVAENTLVPPRNQKGEKLMYAPLWRSWRDQELELARKADTILRLEELRPVVGNLASEISGGQSKLLGIARTLMGEPKMLLLDEPTAGVFPELANRIFEFLVQLKKDFNLTIFVIEHRLSILFKFVEKVMVMHQGKIIAEGLPSDIQKDERIIEVYLGKD